MASFLHKDGNYTTRIVRGAMLSVVLFISQIALSFIPNLELVSTLVICSTMVYGWEILIVVTVFSLLEGMFYGFGLWILSYLYVWPILVILTMMFRKMFKEDFTLWAILAGCFGLIFGLLFAIAYIPVSPSYAWTYWIAGLPWDIWHAIANVFVMMLVGKPIFKVLRRVNNEK